MADILKEESFKCSPANILNLVEIDENDSFKIKNVRKFTTPPEPEGKGEKPLSKSRVGQSDFKKIIDNLMDGKNLPEVWISILSIECSCDKEEKDYRLVIPLIKIFTILKIAIECEQIGRSTFGEKYNGIFPFLVGKECSQIKGDMMKNAKFIFNENRDFSTNTDNTEYLKYSKKELQNDEDFKNFLVINLHSLLIYSVKLLKISVSERG